MEKEMITAEDIILKLQSEHISHYFSEEVKKAMIEFAKLHVEAALKEASNNAEGVDTDNYYVPNSCIIKESILDAYPLTNIK